MIIYELLVIQNSYNLNFKGGDNGVGGYADIIGFT